ncbi:MAG: hypothetical protein AB7J35_10035 [Dehalococcoidia bacterium]
MESAEKVLIVGGSLLLVYAFATGFIMGTVRGREATAPKYLILAHMEPLMQGSMLLGLVWAVQLSDLSNGIETFAASLMVAAAWIQGVKELVNWRQGIEDEFRERPFPGFWAARIQSPIASVGLLILVFGVLRGL